MKRKPEHSMLRNIMKRLETVFHNRPDRMLFLFQGILVATGLLAFYSHVFSFTEATLTILLWLFIASAIGHLVVMFFMYGSIMRKLDN